MMDGFEQLDIDIPTYTKRDGSKASQPFSTSSGAHKLRKPQDVKYNKNSDKERTRFFLEQLMRIHQHIGKPVPYRFRTKDGSNRSLDVGCLGILRTRELIDTVLDEAGYIIAVIPRSAERTSVASDVEAITRASGLTETERQQLINARIGQGQFRDEVLAMWDNRCAVTGCRIKEVIRASHILPWRNANNDQRLDPENGLPLIATLDALFDAGFISFSDNGKLLHSDLLLAGDFDLIGPQRTLLKKPTGRMGRYLAAHRREHGF